MWFSSCSQRSHSTASLKFRSVYSFIILSSCITPGCSSASLQLKDCSFAQNYLNYFVFCWWLYSHPHLTIQNLLVKCYSKVPIVWFVTVTLIIFDILFCSFGIPLATVPFHCYLHLNLHPCSSCSRVMYRVWIFLLHTAQCPNCKSHIFACSKWMGQTRQHVPPQLFHNILGDATNMTVR